MTLIFDDETEGGEEIKNQNKTITANGTYTADAGYTGLGTVTVNVKGIITTITVGE